MRKCHVSRQFGLRALSSQTARCTACMCFIWGLSSAARMAYREGTLHRGQSSKSSSRTAYLHIMVTRVWHTLSHTFVLQCTPSDTVHCKLYIIE